MIESIADEVYEAAFVPERWPAVLARMAQISKSMGAALFLFADCVPTRGIALDSQREQMDEFLASDTLPFSTSVQRVCQSQPAGFIDIDGLMTKEELLVDPAHIHYRALGIGASTGTAISMPGGELAIFVHQRWAKDGGYKRVEINRLTALRPHLARASLIAGRLGLERARSAVKTLESIGLPAAILSNTGRVRATNAPFDALTGLFVATAFGGIMITEAASEKLFRDAIHAVKRGSRPVCQSIPVAAKDDRPPVIIHVLPLLASARDIFTGGDLLLVATALSASTFAPAPAILSGLFDLTPAEAKLAAALTTGLSVKQVASSHGIQVSTARFYLEQVFHKTGTHQQSELVALLKGSQPVRLQE